jgi:hypothetical protein
VAILPPIHRQSTEGNCQTNVEVGGNDHEDDDEAFSAASRNLVEYCKVKLLSLNATHDFGIVDEGCIPDQTLAITASFPTADTEAEQNGLPWLRRGWARHPPKGIMNGEKYLEPFLDDIREMFTKGAENSADKLGAARMLEILKDKYPHRFDMPSENEIRTKISRLYNESCKRKQSDTDGRAPAKRQKIPRIYTQYLEEALAETPTLRPQIALSRLRFAFPDSVTTFDDKKVKAKVSTIKQRAKTTRAAFQF